jgi:hypothetical protein
MLGDTKGCIFLGKGSGDVGRGGWEVGVLMRKSDVAPSLKSVQK